LENLIHLVALGFSIPGRLQIDDVSNPRLAKNAMRPLAADLFEAEPFKDPMDVIDTDILWVRSNRREPLPQAVTTNLVPHEVPHDKHSRLRPTRPHGCRAEERAERDGRGTDSDGGRGGDGSLWVPGYRLPLADGDGAH